MARLFPFRSDPPPNDGPPRIVELEGEDADAVFSALSSTTARRIYATLEDEPATPSDIAERIDSSIQNVNYHLANLEEAGLIEVVDTWYSSRGNEMSVYGTTAGPLIVTSDESTGSRLKTAISRLIGAVGALAGGSLLVQYGATRWFDPSAAGPTDDRAVDEPADDAEVDDGPGVTGTDDTLPEEEFEDEADADEDIAEEPDADMVDDDAIEEDLDAPADDAEPIADDGYMIGEEAPDVGEAIFTLPPGLVFFLGGLTVLLVVTAYWYWYRPSY